MRVLSIPFETRYALAGVRALCRQLLVGLGLPDVVRVSRDLDLRPSLVLHELDDDVQLVLRLGPQVALPVSKLTPLSTNGGGGGIRLKRRVSLMVCFGSLVTVTFAAMSLRPRHQVGDLVLLPHRHQRLGITIGVRLLGVVPRRPWPR